GRGGDLPVLRRRCCARAQAARQADQPTSRQAFGRAYLLRPRTPPTTRAGFRPVCRFGVISIPLARPSPSGMLFLARERPSPITSPTCFFTEDLVEDDLLAAVFRVVDVLLAFFAV